MRDLKRDIIVGEDRTCGSVLTDGDRDGTPRAQLKQFCRPDCWLPVANTLKHANTHIHKQRERQLRTLGQNKNTLCSYTQAQET